MSDRLNAATDAVYRTLVDGIDAGLAEGQEPALQLLGMPPELLRTLAEDLASKALNAADEPRERTLVLTISVQHDEFTAERNHHLMATSTRRCASFICRRRSNARME